MLPSMLNDEAEAKNQQRLFNSIVDDIFSKIPHRLIDTMTGKLCTEKELRNIFQESHGYKEVETKIQMASETEMQRTVDTFFKYAMLSHRWGAEDDEPTYHHIKDAQSIYDLKTPPEIFKLQQFCKTARENQHRWAWSDTCCIDKADNTELQASIMSMFLWYRLSSITIVYLSDVTDEESFRRSGWFTRGWTLPELIAPETVWFYKKDWTPYIDIDQNHKNNSHVATVISEIASIDRHVLARFVPGLRDVGQGEIKKRMGWLASRTTTKIEDMAYCMMGILGVHMPVMYGEKEYAFVRLQKEILYLTEDLSLFDWVGEPSKEHSYLASHPHCFAQTEAERTDKPDKPLRSLTFTGVAADLTAGLVVGLPATFGKNIRKHLNGPPHGNFIVNGNMDMRLSVHKVTELEPMGTTDSHHGLISYHVKARGLTDMTITITAHELLPSITSHKDSPRYRIVRMLGAKFVPPEDVDEEPRQTSGWRGRSKSMDTVMTAVSEKSAVAFFSRIHDPFLGQLLMQRNRGMPYERVGTKERVKAKPSSGSAGFRGTKILTVR